MNKVLDEVRSQLALVLLLGAFISGANRGAAGRHENRNADRHKAVAVWSKPCP